MIDRRRFFALCSVLPVAGATPTTGTVTPPAPLPPREFRRFVRATGAWERITGAEIRAGDHLWVSDPGGETNEVLLVSHNDPSEGVFYSTHKIDPRTNRWVAHGDL